MPIKAGNTFWISAIMKLDRFYAQANEQDTTLQDEAYITLSSCQQLEEKCSDLITQQERLRSAWHSAPDTLRDILRNTSLGHLLEGL